jgi:3-oxo-5alpha-steroid 4-dehydrogenase
MANYVRMENQGAVEDAVIDEFCRQSPGNYEWLQDFVGVPFKNEQGERSFYPRKTSYPPSTATLYLSGNEAMHPWNKHSTPAPRGNRPFGEYLTGHVFFEALENKVEEMSNIDVQLNCSGEKILTSKNEDGSSRCDGVRVRPVVGDDAKRIHNMLYQTGCQSPLLESFMGSRDIDPVCTAAIERIEREFGQPFDIQIAPGGGVVIAGGGYYWNQDMVAKHAPKYEGLMPLGNLGDDGSAINLGAEAGGELGQMNRCTAWKFTNPPYSFTKALLLNTEGERVGDEAVYGATMADLLIQKHNGEGWLLINQEIFDESSEAVMDPDNKLGLQEDQLMYGQINLFKNNTSGNTLNELAEKTDMDPAKLKKTLEVFNRDAAAGEDTQFHKLKEYLRPMTEGPYYAIKLDMKGNMWWATPCMSLGGLRVEGATGRVMHETTKKPIDGLYAAGRSAVGIASNYYVSGLSLADCLFAGRRAGRHIGRNVQSKL